MSQVIGYRAVMTDGTAGYGPTITGAINALKQAAPDLRVCDRTIETLFVGRHADLVEAIGPEPKTVVVL